MLSTSRSRVISCIGWEERGGLTITAGRFWGGASSGHTALPYADDDAGVKEVDACGGAAVAKEDVEEGVVVDGVSNVS